MKRPDGTVKRPNRLLKGFFIACGIVFFMFLLILPHLIVRDNRILYLIAYAPLTVFWGLFYLFAAIIVLMFVIIFINGMNGGYSEGMWKAVILVLVISGIIEFGIGWTLVRTSFTPFSDEPFRTVFYESDDAKNADRFEYELVWEGDLRISKITKYTGSELSVRIPERIMGCMVTEIALDAFEDADIFSVSAPHEPSYYGYDPDKQLGMHWFVAEDGKGGTVMFGRYDRESDSGDAAEDIEWIVLEDRGDSLLLLSRYILTDRRYHEKDELVTWYECDLREWLNGEFLDSAFTEEERGRMIPMTLFYELEDAYDMVSIPDGHDITEHFGNEKLVTANHYGDSEYIKYSWFLRSDYATKRPDIISESGRSKEGEMRSRYGVRPVILIRK